MTFKPPPGFIPAWVDKAALCAHTCLGETTVDAWVRQGLLPPPRKVGGKLMWEWAEVHDWIKFGNPATRELSEVAQIQQGTLRAMSLTSRERELRDMYGIEPKP